MFLVIETLPKYQAKFFKLREDFGMSARVRVAAEGTIYLTREAAEKWIADSNDYLTKIGQPRTFSVLEIPTV